MSAFRFTKSKQAEFLEQIRAGAQRGAAADHCGLNRRKVREFIAENGDFRATVEDAEQDAHELVLEALFQAAASGNVGAARAWLEMKGIHAPSVVGRERGDAPPPAAGDPFAELDNVEALDRRRRAR